MKKKLLIMLLLILFIAITGCDNTTSDESKSKTEESKDVVKQNDQEDNNSEENNEETTNEVNEQPEETPIIEINDNQTENETNVEEQHEEYPSCAAKVFANKYTFVYSTMEECKSRGYTDIYTLWDSSSQYDNITTFGCEAIVDECGTTYYGEYFMNWVGPGVDDYEKYYY